MNMDIKKNKTLIFLVVLLVVAVGYIAVDKLAESRQETYMEYYNTGVQDGQVMAVNAILSNVQQSGFVQITVPLENNETGTVTLVPYQKEQEGQTSTKTASSGTKIIKGD